VAAAMFDALADWRGRRGLAPIERPPILDPARWRRFLLPFARQHFSALQRRTVELYEVFTPYLSVTDPLPVTHGVHDVLPAVHRSVEWWADRNVRSASATPVAWS
jgi:hypothetical protein